MTHLACEQLALRQQVLGFLELMSRRKLPPQPSSYRGAISSCEAATSWHLALQLFRMADESAINVMDSGILDVVIKVLEKGKAWELAWQLFLTQRHISPVPVSSYNAAMSALASGHHWVAVLELLHGMKPADITPDVISYNTSLSSCQPGQWRAARRFFDAMPKSYILPDVITYSTMISVSEKAWQWTDALHLLHSMPSDLKADLPCFSALISSLEKGFQWALALQTLGNISKASLLDTVACNACLAAVEKVTEWEVALQLYHWCLAHGIAVDEVMDGSLLSSVSRGTRWRLALQQFKILSARRKPSPIAMTSLLERDSE